MDFFEVYVDVKGTRQKAWMFLLRGMASKRDFAWLYPRQAQCFLDGHVRAFEWLGAIYQRLLFDSLKPAVAKVLAGDSLETISRALMARLDAEAAQKRDVDGHTVAELFAAELSRLGSADRVWFGQTDRGSEHVGGDVFGHVGFASLARPN